jgi:hypothetical protein
MKAQQHFHQVKAMIECEVEMKEREGKEYEASKSRQTDVKERQDSKLKKTRMRILVILD